MPLYLNDEQSVLFLHIPKTAGTTIESWLEGSGKYEQLLFAQKRPEDLMVTPQHLGYETLTQITHGVKRPLEYKFAIVRNPFDRLVSEFFYRIKLDNIRLGDKPEDLFSSWVTHNLIKFKNNKSILDNHLRPQSYYVSNDVDVFKFEDGVQKIIKNVGEKLGIEVSNEIKAKKVSIRKDVLWSKTAIDLTLEIYADDFKEFNYPTDSYRSGLIQSKYKIYKGYAQYIYWSLERKVRS